MMEMDLQISTKTLEGIPVIGLSGEVDAYTCSRFRDTMIDVIEEGNANIVVSMKDVEYIDSSGLGTLVGGLKRASEKGGKIAVVCSSPQIRKVFEITGLEKVFPLFRSERDAALELAREVVT
ncbi:MAG: STAS domain-containing protein [Armatimonadetes bacterium]|nr:STAS domain-containing protein [Armatimonadota bacterium]